MSTDTTSTEIERLRRELRAMGAVNRGLQAQLDEPAAATKHRRADRGTDWIDRLVNAGAVTPALVRSAKGDVYVVEDDERRAVRAGIVAAALEELLGRPRAVSDAELAGWADGVPVEMFEAPDGAPFVVVGGKRLKVRGIPLSYPVSNRQASAFPEGAVLNVAAANVSRRRYREAMSPRFQLDRAKAAAKRKGVVGTAKSLLRRARKLVS